MVNLSPTIQDWGGQTFKILRLPEPNNRNWSAFNPSIAYSPVEGYAMLIRSSNYILDAATGTLWLTERGDINTRTWLCTVNPDLTISNLREVKFDHQGLDIRRGVEDARLFWRDDGWYFTAVMFERGHTPIARISIYKLNTEFSTATFVEKLEGPFPTRVEKNWLPPSEATDAYDFVYGVTATIKDGELSVFSDADEHEDLRGLRGGSPVLTLKNGRRLALLHRVDVKSYRKYNPRTFGITVGSIRHYTHVFAEFDQHGRIIGETPEFVFDQPGIEYAAGLVEMDDKLVASYGSEDVKTRLASIPTSEVLARLVPRHRRPQR